MIYNSSKIKNLDTKNIFNIRIEETREFNRKLYLVISEIRDNKTVEKMYKYECRLEIEEEKKRLEYSIDNNKSYESLINKARMI